MNHLDKLNADTSHPFQFPMSEGARFRYVVDSHNFIELLERKRVFSEATFGPGHRFEGVIDHIEKELVELRKEPWALEEWVDLIALAIDGAMRQGHDARALLAGIVDKQRKVEGRDYPDWRTADRDKGIEHIRTPEELAAKASGLSYDENAKINPPQPTPETLSHHYNGADR